MGAANASTISSAKRNLLVIQLIMVRRFANGTTEQEAIAISEGFSGGDAISFRRFPMYDKDVSRGFPHRGWRLKNGYLYDNGKQLRALHGPIAKY
ncbi:MAG: hypothetical protein ACR2JB_03730 [Bryobacteraceae bacterium]